MEVELYLCGVDKDDAKSCDPFTEVFDARHYADDNGFQVWAVKASIDFSTMEEI